MLAARAERIAESPTMKVAAEAMALKAQGVDVVDFGAGEPDFPTPQHIGDAAQGRHRRQLHEVHHQLRHRRAEERDRRALSRGLRRRVRDQPRSIITAGGKQALYNAVMVPVRRRRRSHHPHARLADAGRADQARRRHAGDRAHARRGRVPRCKAETFLDALTPRTRGIIINSPGNPTGALISEADLDDGRRRSGAGAASGSCSISATRS